MRTNTIGILNPPPGGPAAALELSAGRLSAADMCPNRLRHRTFGPAFSVVCCQFHVVIVIPDDDNLASGGLIWLVASAAQCSAHPLTQAIVQFAKEHGQKLAKPTVFEVFPEYGARAVVDERVVLIGNHELMRDEGIELGSLEQRAAELEGIGRTVVYVAVDGLKAGAIVIEDRALKLVIEREPVPLG